MMSHEKSSERSRTEKNNQQSLVPIPTDLVVEILKRLPAKSVARFLLVSKLWATIIRSKSFIRSFPSSSQPSRLLIAFNKKDPQNNSHNWYYFSPSQNDQTIPDFHSRARFQVSNLQKFPTQHYVHGLISFVVTVEADHVIINPSTGKSITLPKFKPNSIRRIVRRFFGYDPVDDQHKVLCISTKDIYVDRQYLTIDKYRVLKVGSSSSRWRNIECSCPHRPLTNGLCMDGVVYYLARSGQHTIEQSLVSFDVRSEKLSLVITNSSLPYDVVSRYPSLIRYGDKFALARSYSHYHYEFDLWVLEDAKQDKWSKICLSIRPWKVSGVFPPDVMGLVHTGEIVLTYYNKVGLNVIYHDHKKNTQRRYLMQGDANFDFRASGEPDCFMDYIESVKLL